MKKYDPIISWIYFIGIAVMFLMAFTAAVLMLAGVDMVPLLHPNEH